MHTRGIIKLLGPLTLHSGNKIFCRRTSKFCFGRQNVGYDYAANI